MSVGIRIAGTAFLLSCFACGGGGSSGPVLTISPPSLTVTAGSTPAGFTANLTGSSSPISWSLAGAGSISATSGSTTTYTPPSNLAAATTATLTATAGTLTANATITINVPAINLTVSPTTLSVPAGLTSTLFTATLTGSSNSISWSLSGPGSISAMTGTTTSYTPPLSVTATTNATLTATAGASLTVNVPITITVPTPITVSGTVVDVNNLPVGSASVTVGSQNTLSATDGTFSLSNVTPPYNLIAIFNKSAVVYQELTATKPVIVFFTAPVLPNSGKVTGNISPANFTGLTSVATWGSPETAIFADYDFDFSANPYSITPTWFGPSSTTGNVHVIQEIQDATGYPTSYPGYGMTQGVVLTSANVVAPTITLVSISVDRLSGSLTLPPPPYGVALSLLTATFSDGATALLGSSETLDAGYSFATPSGIGATLNVGAIAENTTTNALSGALISGLATNATNANLTILTASEPELPSDTATGITTTTQFTWTPFAGGINFIVFTPTVATNPTYYVVTPATTTTIPDLSTEGLALPAGVRGTAGRFMALPRSPIRTPSQVRTFLPLWLNWASS